MDMPEPPVTDLRNRAGWSDDPASKLPKMAALLAEATLDVPSGKSVDVMSEGLCLIIGPADTAQAAANKLKDILGVTVLMTDDADAPDPTGYDVIRGTLKRATGALGGFSVQIDALQQVDPSGRGALTWTAPRDGARTECDVILDLTGGTPLFPAPQKREGYLRPDPGSIPAVADAILEASQLIGTFEKPLYVAVEPLLCAHSRAQQTGCTNCLDVCPTGAISPLASMSPSIRWSARAVAPARRFARPAPSPMTRPRRPRSFAASRRWPRPFARPAARPRACWSATKTTASK